MCFLFCWSSAGRLEMDGGRMQSRQSSLDSSCFCSEISLRCSRGSLSSCGSKCSQVIQSGCEVTQQPLYLHLPFLFGGQNAPSLPFLIPAEKRVGERV